MKRLFLIFGLLAILCPAICAQVQTTWTDGALFGDELTLWIYRNEGDKERQPTPCRVAGIEAPRPAGETATRLASTATLALSYLTSGQELQAQIVAREFPLVWDESAKPLPTYRRKLRFVVRLYVVTSSLQGQPVRLDVGEQMLRVGLCWLHPNITRETDGQTWKIYAQAQAEAIAAGRGVWRFGLDWSDPVKPPRPAPKAATPKRE